MKYNTNSPRSVLPNSNRDIVYLTNGIDKNENYRYFSNYSLKQSKNNNKNIDLFMFLLLFQMSIGYR